MPYIAAICVLTALSAAAPAAGKPDRLAIRLLDGGAVELHPSIVELSIYESGRIDLYGGKQIYKPRQKVNGLIAQLRHIGLYSLSQEKLDQAVASSNLPAPSRRPGSGLYAIEFFSPKHRPILIESRNPDHYAGIHEVDVFLKARSAIRSFSAPEKL